MESSVEERGQKELEVRRTVGSCLMHNNLQFDRAQRGGAGCEAAEISEVALTQGAFVQDKEELFSPQQQKTHGTATSVHWKSCRQIDFFCHIFALEAPIEVRADESRGLSDAGPRTEDLVLARCNFLNDNRERLSCLLGAYTLIPAPVVQVNSAESHGANGHANIGCKYRQCGDDAAAGKR